MLLRLFRRRRNIKACRPLTTRYQGDIIKPGRAALDIVSGLRPAVELPYAEWSVDQRDKHSKKDPYPRAYLSTRKTISFEHVMPEPELQSISLSLIAVGTRHDRASVSNLYFGGRQKFKTAT